MRLKRVDITYWTETGEVEFHGHEDEKGDGPIVELGVDDIRHLSKATDAIKRERQRRLVTGQTKSIRPHTGRCS